MALPRDGREGNLPHFKLTHLIFSDDKSLLRKRLFKIPKGLVLVNGGNRATKFFLETLQQGSPIFLFQYTGGAADLAIELLEKVDIWVGVMLMPATRSHII